MNDIIAAMDVSGVPGLGNYKYMGIVIGTKENISSIVNSIGLRKFSASEIKNSKIRSLLSSRLRFNGKENIAICIKIEQDIIIKKIIEIINKKHRQTSHKKIYQKYYYLLFQHIRDKITEFIRKYNHDLTEITFLCDNDCRYFITQNGLHHKICKQKIGSLNEDKHIHNDLDYNDDEYAYVLSDIVAWSNNRGKEPDGVITMDPTDIIEKQLKNAFR